MQIRAISISGLFGTFTHRIPLFSREPVTIIYGPNGVGKTSILRLIYGALTPRVGHLRRTPFSEIELTFVDDSEFLVTSQPRSASSRPGASPTLHFQFRRDGVAIDDFVLTDSSRERRTDIRLASRLEGVLPFLSRIGPDEWHDSQTDAVVSFDEIIHNYGAHLPDEYKGPELPPWLQQLQQSTPVHFIETQRLLDTRPLGRHRPRSHSTQSAVRRCSEDFADRLKSKLAESATLSQALERTFPSRLISEQGVPPSEDLIRDRLADLDRRRARLVDAGILDSGDEPALPTTEFDDTTKRVLAVYIGDTEKKLSVFDDFLSRIELIKSIVNSRFLHKTLSIHRGSGFKIETKDYRGVELTDLSSGEQHELVLLYELLFRANPGTLILLDEPELSLHIAWQQQFLRDFLKITHLAALRALIATHSPQIIHDRWDLTVELSGDSR